MVPLLVIGHQVRVSCSVDNSNKKTGYECDSEDESAGQNGTFTSWLSLLKKVVTPTTDAPSSSAGAGVTQASPPSASSFAGQNSLGGQRLLPGSSPGLEEGLLLNNVYGLESENHSILGECIVLRCFRFQEAPTQLERGASQQQQQQQQHSSHDFFGKEEGLSDTLQQIGNIGLEEAIDASKALPLRRATSVGSFRSVSLSSEPYRKDSLLGAGMSASVISGSSSADVGIGVNAFSSSYYLGGNDSVSVSGIEATMRWTVRRTAKEFRSFVEQVVDILGPESSKELEIPSTLFLGNSVIRTLRLVFPQFILRLFGIDSQIDTVQAEAFLGELLEFCAQQHTTHDSDHDDHGQSSVQATLDVNITNDGTNKTTDMILAPPSSSHKQEHQDLNISALDRVISEFLGLSIASTLSSLGCEGRLQESYLKKRPVYSANDMRATNAIVALQALTCLIGALLSLRNWNWFVLLGMYAVLLVLLCLDLWLTRPSEPNRAWLLPGFAIFSPAVIVYIFYSRCLRRDNVRWFILRESYLAYYDSNYEIAPRGVLLLDHRCKLEPRANGLLGKESHLVRISNADSTLSLLASSRAQARRWRRALRRCLADPAASRVTDPSFFSPERRNTPAQWYSTARFLYKDIKDALDAAKHEIFIAGWMITPELLLVRHDDDCAALSSRKRQSSSSSSSSLNSKDWNQTSELEAGSKRSNSAASSTTGSIDMDNNSTRNAGCTLEAVLAAAVKRGVKVHVLIYRDVEIALPNNSLHAKHRLSAVGVQVIRHAATTRAITAQNHLLPGFGGAASETWFSHHEKLVVVDQKIAFCGGIDLALGRFDDINHSLVDQTISGGSSSSSSSSTSEIRQSSSMWPGKDYYNVLIRDFCNLEEPAEDLLDRSVHPRMPWQDVHCSVGGVAARDVARHFIARWNRELKLGQSFARSRKSAYRPLLPKVYSDLSPLLETDSLLPYKCSKMQVLRSVGPWSLSAHTESSILKKYIELIKGAEKFLYVENQFFNHPAIVDALTDRCIQAFYAHRARKSESTSGGANNDGQHGAMQHDQSDDATAFRIIIVTPQWPAFEGSPFANPSTKIVLHFQHQAMDRVYQRMYDVGIPEQTAKAMISFHALRKADFLHGKLVSSQVYVHSKVIIADDKLCIIGSANLNKRSLNGDRDSEVCVYIDDSNFCKDLRAALFIQHLGLHPVISANVPPLSGTVATGAQSASAISAVASVLNHNDQASLSDALKVISGLPCGGCRLCSSLMRRKNEGALPSAAAAIVDDPFTPLWASTSSRNLDLFCELLPGVQPRDEYTSIDVGSKAEAEGKSSGQRVSDHETIKLTRTLQGTVVDAPLGFLRKEKKMLPSITDPSSFLLPIDSFL